MSSKRNSKVKTYNPKTRGKNRKLIAVAIIAVIAIAVVAFVVIDQSGSHKASPNQAVSSPSPSPTASASPTSSTSPFPSVTPLTSPAGEYSASSTKVLFITSMGDIVIQMRNDKPITTTNFVNLVKEGYYNNTIFQRVIAGFMIQGGEGKTSEPTIQDEIGNVTHNVNSDMTIAMANTGAPNSASTQFFINVVDNSSPSFDASYTVFGQVIYGQNVVMAISKVPVEANPAYNGEVSEPITTVTLIGAVVMP